MFLQDEGSTSSGSNETAKQLTGLAAATGDLNFNIKEFKKTVSANLPLGPTGLKGIANATAQLEDLSFRLSREVLGQTSIIGKDIQSIMAQAAFESAQYGISLDDQFAVFRSINEVMQRNTVLTSEQQTDMALLARNAGVAAGDIATMVEAFDSIGVNTDDAINNISKMQQEARSYGINVGQFMKNIGSNIKLLNSYNFKNGVEGFTKMVAKAQALRIDFNKTVSLADSLLSPETAIETAAGFQMLGGAVGDLGDPFKLLYMAQNDVEGLQDSILGMAESATVFNEKTGEFDIPVTEMYRLREAAKLTGMDYQELANTAVKSAERTRKLDMLAGSGLDDDTKELIANLGEIKDGEVKIKVPGTEELIDARLLGNEDQKDVLEKLNKQQEMAEKSDRTIAENQLSTLEKINKNLTNQVAALGPLIGTKTGAVESAIDAAGAGAQSVMDIVNQSFTEENVSQLGEAFTEAAKSGFKNPEAVEVMRARFGDVLDSLNTEMGTFDDKLKENLDDESIFKTTEGFNALGSSLQKLGIDIDEFKTDALEGVFNGIEGNIDDFIKGLIALDMRIGQHDEQRPDEQEGNAPESTTILTTNSGTQTVTPVTPVTPNTNVQDTSNLNQTTTQGVLNGDVNLNVGGTIDFAIDGRNLPQNISTEELASQIVNNPNFTSKLMSIFTDSNNTYSV